MDFLCGQMGNNYMAKHLISAMKNVILKENKTTMSQIKRQPISQKIRFEVFKRDSFTCKYCGKKAPDVILELDHVIPISKGGNGDILNLITSCYECNRGKSDTLLSDTTLIDKQRDQIEELQERKNQIEMMLQWKMGLSKLNDFEADRVIQYCNTKSTYFVPNESAQKEIRSLVKKYGAGKVIAAMDESFERYYTGSDNGESYSYAFNKMKGALYLNSLSPDQRAEKDKIAEVLRYARAAWWNYDYQQAIKAINAFMRRKGTIEELWEISKRVEKFKEWKEELYYA